jgi:hypothetical protein
MSRLALSRILVETPDRFDRALVAAAGRLRCSGAILYRHWILHSGTLGPSVAACE